MTGIGRFAAPGIAVAVAVAVSGTITVSFVVAVAVIVASKINIVAPVVGAIAAGIKVVSVSHDALGELSRKISEIPAIFSSFTSK